MFVDNEEFEWMWRNLVSYAKQLCKHAPRVDAEDLAAAGVLRLVMKVRREGVGTLDAPLRWTVMKVGVRNCFTDEMRSKYQSTSEVCDSEELDLKYKQLEKSVRRTPEGDALSREGQEVVRLGLRHLPGYLDHVKNMKNTERNVKAVLLRDHLGFSWPEIFEYFGEEFHRHEIARGRSLLRGWCHALLQDYPPTPKDDLSYWKHGHDAGVAYLRNLGAVPIPLPA